MFEHRARGDLHAGRHRPQPTACTLRFMPAYVIVDVSIHDPVAYEKYKPLAHKTVVDKGGKYIARGGNTQILEGEWQPGRVVILEFPNAAKAKEWLECAEYAPARAIRHATAKTNMILVDGV